MGPGQAPASPVAHGRACGRCCWLWLRSLHQHPAAKLPLPHSICSWKSHHTVQLSVAHYCPQGWRGDNYLPVSGVSYQIYREEAIASIRRLGTAEVRTQQQQPAQYHGKSPQHESHLCHLLLPLARAPQPSGHSPARPDPSSPGSSTKPPALSSSWRNAFVCLGRYMLLHLRVGRQKCTQEQGGERGKKP